MGENGDHVPLSASPGMPALFGPQVPLCGHCCGCFQYQRVHARQDESANQTPVLWLTPVCNRCNGIHVGFLFQVSKGVWVASFVQFHWLMRGAVQQQLLAVKQADDSILC